MNKRSDSIKDVISNGYCIGCGACTYSKLSPFHMSLNKYGQYEASISEEQTINNNITSEISKVCPFSNESTNESVLGNDLYASNCKNDNVIGYYLQTYAGYVVDDEHRSKSSSGGFTTWILEELLSNKHIDGVLHVKHTSKGDKLFEYTLSTSLEEIRNGAKTRYYPIEMSSILQQLKNLNGKYAIVGLPCFIKAIRLLQKEHKEVKDKIKFCIGLVCGHLKSTYFADLWAWQLSIKPQDIIDIDFRTKLKDYGANQYGITVKSKKETKISQPLHTLYGSNWGWGFFKNKACDYCDDIFSECADITLGDAWLPKYVSDTKGTNILIVRNQTIADLLISGETNDKIKLEQLSLDDTKKSQSSGVFHRRNALAYRLSLLQKNNNWAPIKRVNTSSNQITNKQKKIQDLRMIIAKQSLINFHEALEKDSFEYFIQQMRPFTEQYQKLYKRPIYRRIMSKLLNYAKRK